MGVMLCPATDEIRVSDAPETFDRLFALIKQKTFDPNSEKEVQTALDTIAERHIQNPQLSKLLQFVTTTNMYHGGKVEALLRKASQENSDFEMRSLAYFCLARHLRGTIGFSTERFAEADKIFNEVINQYSIDEFGREIQYTDDARGWTKPLSEAARLALYEMRELALGKTAPEIEGETFDGKPIKLSDYRNKIVLLEFSGDWCGACRLQYPWRKEIEKQMEGRPFVFFTVNIGDEKDDALRTFKEENLHGPCLWDGGNLIGPVAKGFNYPPLPTYYVVDEKGVFRGVPDEFNGFGGETRLQERLEELLKKLEETSSPKDQLPTEQTDLPSKTSSQEGNFSNETSPSPQNTGIQIGTVIPQWDFKCPDMNIDLRLSPFDVNSTNPFALELR